MAPRKTQPIILARTQPRRELWAAENIAAQGHKYYMPRCYVQKDRAHSRSELKIEPLFPGYIFVYSDQWHWLMGTFGVVSVIMRGEAPDWVSSDVIDYVRSLEDSPDKGVVLLPETPLEIGQVVRINSDGQLFHQHLGVVQGMSGSQRVHVLIDFLGGKTKVLVKRGSLEVVSAAG